MFPSTRSTTFTWLVILCELVLFVSQQQRCYGFSSLVKVAVSGNNRNRSRKKLPKLSATTTSSSSDNRLSRFRLGVSTTVNTRTSDDLVTEDRLDSMSSSTPTKDVVYNDQSLTVIKEGVSNILSKAEAQSSSLVVDMNELPNQMGGTSTTATTNDNNPLNNILANVQEKIGIVHEDRYVFPELTTGEVPRLFSSLEYTKQAEEDNNTRFGAIHAAGSVLGAIALIAGTTVGAGILALPTATAAAGFLPSSAALIVAWIYMTFSGLLIAELTLNQLGTTGRPGLGLLELYKTSLSEPWSAIGSGAYFFLHYAMMVAYIAQGGVNVNSLLTSIGISGATLPDGIGQVTFATICAASLFASKPSLIENINNVLVLGVAATFAGIMAIGAGNADWGALLDASNQHPDQVVNCFPILFLALVYQNVVPTIVTQLEGDRSKIIKAIVGGTTIPLLMFVAWNGVVLGNALGSGVDLSVVDPVAALQTSVVSGASSSVALGPLVSAFSSLALVTSIIGFTYGLIDAWTDVFQISTRGPDYEKYKLPLFGLVFGPPLALSLLDPDIFYRALEYGGAFGVSTLFLVLPPVMVWKERYGNEQKPLITKPMVPFGKLSLGSMWKAAATLILEQGAEKLGLFEYIQDHLLHFTAS